MSLRTQHDIEFLEQIAEAGWNLMHGDEDALMEHRLGPFLLNEVLDKAMREKLKSSVESTRAEIDAFIASLPSGMKRTKMYFQNQLKSMPGETSLFVAGFFDDPKEAGKKISDAAVTQDRLNAARKSVYDSVIAMIEQLEQNEAVAGLLDAEEGSDAAKDVEGLSMKELAKKAKDEGFDAFPDEAKLKAGVEELYEPPPKRSGFLGKLADFFGVGVLTQGEVVADMLDMTLAELKSFAETIKADMKDAEEDQEQTEDLAQDLEDEMQALSQGDVETALGPDADKLGTPGDAEPPEAEQGTGWEMPGGDINVTLDLLKKLFPGLASGMSIDKAGEKRRVSMDELRDSVTEPAGVPGATASLAAMINADPEAEVVFFDPEELKDAQKEQGTEGTGDIPANAPEVPQGDLGAMDTTVGGGDTGDDDQGAVGESTWLYRSSLSELLFEHYSVSEAIELGDLVNIAKSAGASDEEADAVGRQLGSGVQQYGVKVSGLSAPEEGDAEGEPDDENVEVAEETEEAGDNLEAAEKAGITPDEVREIVAAAIADAGVKATDDRVDKLIDILQQREQNDAARASAELERAGIAPNIQVNVSQNVSQELSTTQKQSGKKKKKGPPTDDMKKRGEEVDLEPKEGETGDAFGKRVRRAEEKAGIRTKKEKEPGEEPEEAAEEKGTTTADIFQKAEQGVSLTSGYLRKGFLVEFLCSDKQQTQSRQLQTEALIERQSENELLGITYDTDELEHDRWLRMAGIKDE